MSSDRKEQGLNDAILFRCVSSGFSEDVARLFEMTDYKITSFSNHALNWSVIQACYMGHALLVQFLLQDNARLEVRDDDGNTPLLICSEKGMSELVSMLLLKGADVNAANSNGDTALFLATSLEVVRRLLGQTSMDVDHQNIQGYTALMSAIEGLHYEKISLLINAGACVDGKASFHQGHTHCCIYRVNSSGENASQIAQRAGILVFIEVLKQSRILACSPLVCAALNSDLETFDFLLQHGLCELIELSQGEHTILSRMLRALYRKQEIHQTDIKMFERVCNLVCDTKALTKPDLVENIELAVEIGHYDIVEILCLRGALLNHNSLVIAVNHKHTNLIPLLAYHGAPMNRIGVNGCDEYPGSALDLALTNSDIGSASLLLYHGASINLQYALNKAVEASSKEIITFLLDECREDARSVLETSQDIFHRSLTTGDVETVEMLLASGSNVDSVFDDRTPLMVSAHLDVITFLLSRGADVNLKTTTTPLINILSSSYLRSIHASVNHKITTDEVTDLILEMITLLLDHGANINDVNELGQTALIYSVANNLSTKIVRLLLKRGSSVYQLDKSGNSVLHEAVSFCNMEMLATLLEYGANVNFQNKCGYSLLHSTIESESVQSLAKVHTLLEHKADVYLEDRLGNTPLLCASEKKSEDIDLIVGLLLTYGSNINHTNKNGLTALMIAAECGNDVSLPVLLKAKAEVNTFTESHGRRPKTALSIVLNKWYPNWRSQRMALELLDHGATVKYVRPDVIHRLIVLGNYNLMWKLISSGLCPSDVILETKLNNWPIKAVSPLSVCLMIGNLQLAQYLIENWYLTKTDIKVLSRDETILDNVSSTTGQYLMEVSTQPLRLELLSFICVSTALGSGSDREDKVKKSQLPTILQEYLLCSKVEHEAFDEEDDDADNISLLSQMTRKQKIDDVEENRDFYVQDEDWFTDFYSQSSEEEETSEDN